MHYKDKARMEEYDAGVEGGRQAAIREEEEELQRQAAQQGSPQETILHEEEQEEAREEPEETGEKRDPLLPVDDGQTINSSTSTSQQSQAAAAAAAAAAAGGGGGGGGGSREEGVPQARDSPEDEEDLDYWENIVIVHIMQKGWLEAAGLTTWKELHEEVLYRMEKSDIELLFHRALRQKDERQQRR
eukprot:3339849-Amphidinium_carterae.2